MPDSIKEIALSLINILFLSINIWYIPVFLGFKISKVFFNENFTYIIFELLPNLYFQLNIFITLNRAYFYKGTLLTDKVLIFKNYMKTSFLLDFITLIPFYFGSLLFQLNYLYLLRVINLRKALKSVEETFQFSDKNQYLLKLIKLYMSVFYMIHIIGCFTHLISFIQVNNGDNNTWLNITGLVDKNWDVRYINSVYYAVLTMITAGYNNTDSLNEKIFSIFSVIILSSTFAYSINTIGIILQEMNKNEGELK